MQTNEENAALQNVMLTHEPVEIEPSDTICRQCSYQLPNGRFFGKIVEWPCPTVAAIESALGRLTRHDAEVKAAALREAAGPGKPQTCARCGVAPDGTYWPTCADVVYKHPERQNWASLHDVVCGYVVDEGMEVCADCEVALRARADELDQPTSAAQWVQPPEWEIDETSVRSGWGDICCPLCDWYTTGWEPVCEDAWHEHCGDRHPNVGVL